MKHWIKFLFGIEKKPRQGLLVVEWVVMGYLLLTLLLALFTYTNLPHPEQLIWGRFHIAVMTAAMWLVYRLIPCRFTHLCRIGVQLFLLSWWYPDTYEFNRMFPNLDHLFAGWEQQLFGCQPALLFAQQVTNPVFSELMHLGYASYYPLIAMVTVYYFFLRYEEFDKAVFIILTSFFVYYIIFIFLPVAGPQYYFPAVGIQQIAEGIFPSLNDYFATHDEAMTMPGYADGFFYQCVEAAHQAGERPTAAFPSSHVGITAILLILAWRTRSKILISTVLLLFILMSLATVYIRAHYAIDVIGGLLSAVVIYVILNFFAKKFV